MERRVLPAEELETGACDRNQYFFEIKAHPCLKEKNVVPWQ